MQETIIIQDRQHPHGSARSPERRIDAGSFMAMDRDRQRAVVAELCRRGSRVEVLAEVLGAPMVLLRTLRDEAIAEGDLDPPWGSAPRIEAAQAKREAKMARRAARGGAR